MIQRTGGAVNGNWITGINFLDEPRVGTSDLPSGMKNDTSRNVYFLLPFLLGIFGLFLPPEPRLQELVGYIASVSYDRGRNHFLP